MRGDQGAGGAGEFRQGRNFLVVWRVTTSCNLGCDFCGYNERSDGPRQEVTPGAVAGFGRVLAEYGEATDRTVRVSWLGGEPFMWSPIHWASAELAGAGLSLSATTNGSALGAKKAIGTIRDNFDVLHVSFDGVGAEHDRSRKAPGLYQRALRGIERIVAGDSSTQVGVNLLLTAESLLRFDELCRELGEAGVTFLSFNPLVVDSDSAAASRKLTAEHLPLLRELESGRLELHRQTGVDVLGGPRYFARVDSYVRGERVPVGVAGCRPGESRIFVDEFGRVRPCSFVGDSGERTLVSEIESVDDLGALSGTFAGRIRAERPPPCGDCMDPFNFDKFVGVG